MRLLLDSFWRATVYMLHPRVIALSLAPLVVLAGSAFALGYFFWEDAISWVRDGLDSYALLASLWRWLQDIGVGNLKTVVAPLVVIFGVTPVLVLACLLMVTLLMTPAVTHLVVARRFAHLERRGGHSLLMGILWSLGSTLLAVLAMVVSIPLWLIPPLILIIPPLIWGWLTYRVMAYDVLAAHATREERQQIFRAHRGSLLGIGLICGYMGAAPGLVWISGAVFAAAFVFLIPVAIWLYTFVFVFSSLWFAHFALAALEQLRAAQGKGGGTVVDAEPAVVSSGIEALPSPDAHVHTLPKR